MENNSNDRQSIEIFQKDFIRGCITFLTIAMQMRGHTNKTPDELFKEFIQPIIGNRNPETTPFHTVIPELFQKVNEYCADAIDKSNKYEDRMDFK